MRILTHRTSPHFTSQEIPAEFLVLHYTACSLERTLEIFSSPDQKTCAHFVLDTTGDIYDLGGFWSGPLLQGAHAGESRWNENGRTWEKFNLFSVGVEIVNSNGNLFPYTEAQYQALQELTLHLQSRFPALRNPERVLGHEQIAGFRGKVDPGLCFDWSRFFVHAYPGLPVPVRKAVLSLQEAQGLQELVAQASEAEKASKEFWASLSSRLEKAIKEKKSAAC